MNAERLATALSVAVLLALAGWLTVKVVPSPASNSQEFRAQEETFPEKTSQRTPKSAARPAAAVVHLPPPPRLLLQTTAATLPATAVRASLQTTRKAPASPVKPLRPSPDKPVAAPAVARLTPAEPPVPKPAAVPPKLQPLAPKPQPEPPSAERPPNVLVAPIPPKPRRIAIKSKPQATAITSAPESSATVNPAEPHDDAPATPNRAALREGRVLLRVLEHGAGPSIEIAWPEAAATRTRLYRRLKECFGMRVALMRGGKLFTEAGPPGQPWAINLDRFSGFVRQPAGHLVAGEQRLSRRIRARHRGLSGAALVRIFPRRVDALLLAGLKRIAGAAYKKQTAIRARYRLTGGRVVVEDVRIDGRAAPGRIDLTPAGRSCRGGA